jgi:Zn-dependent protease with chaperone function
MLPSRRLDRWAKAPPILCIADPLGSGVNLKEGFWSDLFASHPPMASRTAALKEMAFQGHNSL